MVHVHMGGGEAENERVVVWGKLTSTIRVTHLAFQHEDSVHATVNVCTGLLFIKRTDKKWKCPTPLVFQERLFFQTTNMYIENPSGTFKFMGFIPTICGRRFGAQRELPKAEALARIPPYVFLTLVHQLSWSTMFRHRFEDKSQPAVL